MRRYITEKVGILECFQIIVIIVTLCLAYYAFSTDVTWNHTVDHEGIFVCININNAVKSRNTKILHKSECTERLDIKNEQDCESYIQSHYLMNSGQERDKTRIKMADGTYKDMKKFIHVNMKRKQASETSSVVIINCIFFVLVIHMLLASLLNNISIRTKWNAALQGIIMFSCGFGAMLLAISVNSIDNKYVNTANQIEVCGMLRFCDRGTTSHPELDKSDELVVNDVLTRFHACQDVAVKESICILLIIMIGTCAAMILLAMDLTTKYEQSEEEELIHHEAKENLELILQDQTVVFENPSETSHTSQPQPLALDEMHPPGMQHLKSGSTVIAEYLAVSRPH